MGLFDEFDTVKREHKNLSEDAKAEYAKYYLDMIRKYRDEIMFIEDIERARRKEMTDFMSRYEEFKKVLVEDSVKPEVQEAWLEDFRNCMMKSFDVTDRLISAFTVEELNRFKREYEERIKR